MSTVRKLLAILCVSVILVSLNSPTSALADGPVGGFDRDDFEKIAEGGFGDEMNNYAWSMGYFKGDLYVGVGRNSCWGVLNGMGLPSEITDVVFEEITVPSGTPGSLEFANDMRGEIWRYHDGEWERVYQSTVRWWSKSGVWLADEIGFRGEMITFTDKWGEEAIYASRAGAVPPMHVILKSTDGTTWERVITPLQTFGTPRAMAVHNGKLYVGGGEAGPSGGGPFIWATDDPSTTSYNWTKVADFTGFGPGTNTAVGSLASFNDYLYAGVDNRETGFQVFRSDDQLPDEPELGDWTQIVNFGAGDMHNWRAACMDILDNQLYVGSLSLPGPGDAPGFMLPKGFEIIRIDTSDNWQLVVGDYFALVPPPSGPTFRPPISGWPGGFGNFLNWYCWSMQAHEDVLYIGSFDTSSFLQLLPEEFLDLFPELTPTQHQQIVSTLEDVIEKLEELGVSEVYIEPFRELLYAFQPIYKPVDWEEVWQVLIDYFAGADLWKTEDGICWEPVTLNGFDNPDNYGFRNMVHANPLFIGTANPFKGGGLEIWQARGKAKSIDEVGVGKDVFTLTDDVYATGSGFPPNTDVDVYVVRDLAWSDRDPIPADVGDGRDTVTTDDDGNLGPVMVWQAPLTPGEYDLVFDTDQDGVYDFIGDYIDDPNHPGFIVQQVADFSANPREGPAPLTVQFTDLSPDNITSWVWHFGDGESSRDQNPTHVYGRPGIYSVSLTVTGPGGTDREVKVDYIEAFSAVAPARLFVRNLQISPAQIYPNQPVTISAEVVNQGGRYGSKRVDLVINGQAEQMTRAGVHPGTAHDIYFYTTKSVPETYEVFIEGETATFTVLLRPHAPPPAAGTAGGLDTNGIIAIAVTGVILIVGVFVIFTVRRNY